MRGKESPFDTLVREHKTQRETATRQREEWLSHTDKSVALAKRRTLKVANYFIRPYEKKKRIIPCVYDNTYYE